MRGLSEVMGMIDDTVFRNIVSDNSMVTPNKYQQQITLFQEFNIHSN